jgi:hypothetical protein
MNPKLTSVNFYLKTYSYNFQFETREFKFIREIVEKRLIASLQFNYLKDEVDLKRFIKINFADNKFGLSKIKIDKNFPNVKGQFPIGFKIWNTNIKEPFEIIVTDLFIRCLTIIYSQDTESTTGFLFQNM